jgi:hydrogenase maturation protease
MSGWEALERPGPDSVLVGGVEVRAGSRVRLHPRPGGDLWDVALGGRSAVVDAIECDVEDRVHVAVIVEDDPGGDLGRERRMGHRFFYAPDELEPLPARPAAAAGSRILVAGIGNVFLGDDGFGVALAARLARRELPPGAEVVDFGIRGMDLAYAMGEGYDTVILLDAVPRGQAAGTVYVIEADLDTVPEGTPDAHGMDPVQVIALARTLGERLPRTLVVGCEPAEVMTGEEEDVVYDLSEPVRAALAEAERLVVELLDRALPEGEPAHDMRQREETKS